MLKLTFRPGSEIAPDMSGTTVKSIESEYTAISLSTLDIELLNSTATGAVVVNSAINQRLSSSIARINL